MVRFYETVEDEKLKFAVIISKTNRFNVFCKHRDRNTLEIPGGHRETGETILETAQRELYEETGAVDFQITPICVCSVATEEDSGPQETFGMLYYAEIASFEKELHSEIETIVIIPGMPETWTYPQIQPKLIEEAERRGFLS